MDKEQERDRDPHVVTQQEHLVEEERTPVHLGNVELDGPPDFVPLQSVQRLLGESNYAVVAKVTGVSKVARYTAESQGESDAEVAGTSPDTFAVTGELVAIESTMNRRAAASTQTGGPRSR